MVFHEEKPQRVGIRLSRNGARFYVRYLNNIEYYIRRDRKRNFFLLYSVLFCILVLLLLFYVRLRF